ncbi:MAG: hypothetical protein GF401_04345 [Chitinivibrionales bacterium]|nr:hypothetical protein [Chitinivibrionales bacterium]
MKEKGFLYASLFALVILVGSIIAVQNKLTNSKDASWYKESMAYLPQSHKIKPYLLGFHTTFANHLWIKTMLYFGKHYDTDRKYPWLVSMVDIVTRLNPRFFPAYEFAGLMLADHSKNPEAARIILKRGISVFGTRRWKLPFYLGWLHFQHYNDKETAAIYLKLASKNEKAPAYVHGLAASFMYHAGKKEQALLFLKSLYSSTENPRIKEHIKRKLELNFFGSFSEHVKE